MPAVRSTRAFFVTLLATAFAVLAGFCALPDDRYLRFQSLTDSAVVKAGWIYERIHFDPSPIDTVIIGTSHSVFGINSAEVEQACAAGGGKCATVNFALQHLGRNLHWLMAREVLQSRKPRLLIIEVQDSEPRAMHPAFPYLADASDIVSAPLVINTSFFPDLVRLPFRQFGLFIKSGLPRLFDLRTQFDLALYRGPHWDDTFSEVGSIEQPVANPQPRTGVHSAAELDDERAHSQITQGGAPKLPASLRPLEYRANLIYLEKIVTLAREKGVEVRFLYMPTFHGPRAPEFDAFYGKFAPVWHLPEQIVERPELWLDVGHFNSTGADLVSRWLGAKIANATKR